MFNFNKFSELLPKRIQCKKETRFEKAFDRKYTIFLGYDENNCMYIITKDKKGNDHFEEEQKSCYEILKTIGDGIDLSYDSSLLMSQPQQQSKKITTPKRKITLIPSENRFRKGYSTIIIKFGNNTYSVVGDNGIVELLQNGKSIELDSTNKKNCHDILAKPFEISLLDQLKLSHISHNENDRLNHIAKDAFGSQLYVAIDKKRIQEWNEIE